MNDLLGISTVVFAVLGFCLGLFFDLKTRGKANLSRLFSSGMGASLMPAGAVFVYSALDPDYLKNIDNSSTYIALAGLALIYVACVTFFEQSGLGRYLERLKGKGDVDTEGDDDIDLEPEGE